MGISPVSLCERQNSTILGPSNVRLRIAICLTWYLNGAALWCIHVVWSDNQFWCGLIPLSRVLRAAVPVAPTDYEMCARLLEPHTVLGSAGVQPRVWLLHMVDGKFMPCSEGKEIVTWSLQVLRYSWKGVWGLCYSRIRYYITRLLVQMYNNNDYFQISRPRRRRQYVPSKCQEIITPWHGITSQWTGSSSTILYSTWNSKNCKVIYKSFKA